MNTPTGIQYRTVIFDKPDAADVEEFGMACSSEEPVERSFGTEVLDHSPESVDMSRMKSGAPLLVNHDPADQVGVVTQAVVDSDKRMRAKVKFSKSARGREIRQDVLDGIRTQVSVGYQILQGANEKREGSEIFRVTRWLPMEVSLVAIPADQTVGVGRSVAPERDTQPVNSVQPTQIMETKIEVTQQGESPADFTKRKAELLARGKQYGMVEEAYEAIERGTTIQEFTDKVLAKRFNGKPVADVKEANIGMSERETKQFSIRKAIMDIVDTGALQGLEREASMAAATKYNRASTQQHINIPFEVMSKRADTAGTGSQGGYGIQTNVLSLVELLRNKMRTAQAGVKQMAGLVGNVSFPKQTGAATLNWLAETAANTGSSQTLGQVNMTPHRAAAFTDFSRQLMIQNSFDTEAYVRNDLANVGALGLDLAVLAGTGASNQPTGILNTSGIGTVTFSAAATWAKMVSFYTAINTANADIGAINWIASPDCVGKWQTNPKIGSTFPTFIMEDGKVNGYPVLDTAQAANDIVYFGVFSQCVLGLWGGVTLLVDPYTQAASGLVRIHTEFFADVGVLQPTAFAVSTDSGAQ